MATPETPAAAKAKADADAAVNALETKKANDLAKAQKDAADAKGKEDADAAAAKAKADADAAKGPPEPTNEILEQRNRTREAATFRSSAARLFHAFMSPEVGLSNVSASVLAAHCMATMDEAEHIGGTEAIAWAKGFRQQNPIVWSALRIGHLMNFCASMRRAGIDTMSPDELAQAATVIRG